MSSVTMSSESLSFLIDDPIDKDFHNDDTGLHRIAEKLFLISQAIPTPSNGDAPFSKHLELGDALRGSFCCSVSGDWGGGKTSLLNLLQHKFDNTAFNGGAKCTTVWFEPWRYENEEHLIIPLLIRFSEQIISAIKEEEQKKTALAIRKKMVGCLAKGLLKSMGDYIERRTDVNVNEIGSKLLNLYADVKEGVEKSAIEKTTVLSELENFKQEFKNLIALSAKCALKDREPSEEKLLPPVIIFIDDLDRCKSEQVRRLIESIKLFMHEKGVYFFMALDKRQVLRAIAEGFAGKDKEIQLHRAKLYLEKFFQLNIELNERSIPYKKDVGGFATTVRDELNPEELWLQMVKKCRVESDDIENLGKDFIGVIDVGFANIKPNPRAIKKIARWLYYQTACPSGKPFSEKEIYVLLFNFLEYVIENNWPDLWVDSLSLISIKARARLYNDMAEKIPENTRYEESNLEFNTKELGQLVIDWAEIFDSSQLLNALPLNRIFHILKVKTSFLCGSGDYEQLTWLKNVVTSLEKPSTIVLGSSIKA